jgi:hypothetical protein
MIPRWLEPYTIYNIFMARSSKYCLQQHGVCLVLSHCYVALDQWYATVLLNHLTTVIVHMSGQQGRRCTVVTCPHVLHALMMSPVCTSYMP